MFHKSLFRCIKSVSDNSLMEVSQRTIRHESSGFEEDSLAGKRKLINKVRRLKKKIHSASNGIKSIKFHKKTKTEPDFEKSWSFFSQKSTLLSSTTIAHSEHMYQQYLEASGIRADFYSDDSDFSDDDCSDISRDESLLDLDQAETARNNLSLSSVDSIDEAEAFLRPVEKIESFNLSELSQLYNLINGRQCNFLSSTCCCGNEGNRLKRFTPVQTSSRKSLLIENKDSDISFSSSDSLISPSTSIEVEVCSLRAEKIDMRSSTLISSANLNTKSYVLDQSEISQILTNI